jgi:hypothetical protein
LNVENLATMLFARGVTYPDVYCGTHTYIYMRICMYVYIWVMCLSLRVYCLLRRATRVCGGPVLVGGRCSCFVAR